MTPEEEAARVEELRTRICSVPVLPDDPRYTSDTDNLRRFLVAREWRVDDAEKLLRSSTEWRRTYRPLSVQCSWCEGRPGFHCMRQVGFDKQQRPVLYSCFRQQATRKNSVEDTVAHCAFVMENAIRTMRPGVSKMVYVLDCTGITLACCNPKLAQGCTNVFANFYPERLGLVILINHSPVFQGVWKAVRSFLDQKTVSKVYISRSKEKISQMFKDTFPTDLSQWLKEEIELNKQKTYSVSQKQFWEFPQNPRSHDPRGCIDYIMNYIEPYIAYCRLPSEETLSIHKPHPNVIARLQGDVVGKIDLKDLDEDSLTNCDEASKWADKLSGDSLDDLDSACATLEIPPEYQIEAEENSSEDSFTHL